ncbi:MAG: hypothetical protein K0B14_18870 [Anaerolineaceae bacterium]|nr:hypothetical protein [Anaerolineaceae bacterium]
MQNSWLNFSRSVLMMDKTKMRFLMGLILVGHVFTLAFSWGKTTGSTNAPEIEYHRTNNKITLSLHTSAIQWQLTDTGTSISIPNAQILTHPGDPNIPYFSTIVALPPGTSLQTILNNSPELRVSPPDDLKYSFTSESEMVHNSFEQSNNSCSQEVSQNPIQIGDPFWYRDQYLVSINFYPIRWDCISDKFLFIKDLELKITFDDPLEFSENLNMDLVDDINPLELNIINPHDGFLWKADPPVLWGGEVRDPWKTRARIEVEEPGIYRISFEDLQYIGFDLEGFNPVNFHIENQGREVAYQFEGDEDAIFEPGESFLFYGEQFQGDYLSALYAHQSDHWPAYGSWQPEFSAFMLEKYTNTNVYWLYISEIPGLRITEIDGTPQSGNLVTTFVDQARFEEEKVWWTYHFTNEDTWFWEYSDVSTFPTTKNYLVQLVDPLISSLHEAQLNGEIVSASSSSALNPDHHLQFFLNDQLLSDDDWDGAVRHSFSGSINQQHLIYGENKFSYVVQSVGLPAARYGFDWFSVSYTRALKAVNGQLSFNIRTSESVDVQVENLPTSQNYLWNISDPLQPIAIQNPEFEAGKLTFNQDITERESYIVTNVDAIKAGSENLSLYTPPDLLSSIQQTDYLIISPKPFLEDLQPLVDYRSSQGYEVRLVDLQDVYNQFNFGIAHPIAIKNFFGYIYQHWDKPAPAYVLLVGDGHWDLKNVKSSEEIFMPPNFVWVDPLQGEVDSLSDLVSVAGDDIFPDAMIGRLPVNSSQELQAFIDKTIQFENGDSEWKKNLTFVADNYYLQNPENCIDNDPTTVCSTDPAGNFPAIVNQIIADVIQAPYQINKIFLDDYDCRSISPDNCTQVRTDIAQAFNQGNQIVSFNGHGAIPYWTAEKVLHVDHIPALTNKDLYPVMFSLDCVDGYWYFPPNIPGQTTDRRSLAEELTRVPDKGAVAMLSSPGNGYVNGHELLQRGFFSAFSNLPRPTLGALDLNAKITLMANHGNDSLIFTYMIFGDPALQLSPIRWGIYLPMVSR